MITNDFKELGINTIWNKRNYADSIIKARQNALNTLKYPDSNYLIGLKNTLGDFNFYCYLLKEELNKLKIPNKLKKEMLKESGLK